MAAPTPGRLDDRASGGGQGIERSAWEKVLKESAAAVNEDAKATGGAGAIGQMTRQELKAAVDAKLLASLPVPHEVVSLKDDNQRPLLDDWEVVAKYTPDIQRKGDAATAAGGAWQESEVEAVGGQLGNCHARGPSLGGRRTWRTWRPTSRSTYRRRTACSAGSRGKHPMSWLVIPEEPAPQIRQQASADVPR